MNQQVKGPKVAIAAQVGIADAMRRRWRLQRVAQGIMRADRVAGCGRHLQEGAAQVWKGAGAATYRGVMTCGSVWHCPVCAAKITDRRREQLNAALATWRAQGGGVYLLTFTFRHAVNTALGESLTAMQDAQRAMKGRRAYKALMESCGAIGSVKALEVTHGANGWHPHVHILVFARPGLLPPNAAMLEGPDAWGDFAPLFLQWRAAAAKAGLDMTDYGFDARGGQYAADYIAKFGLEPRTLTGGRWGPGSELTRGHMKTAASGKGRTPFALLADAGGGDREAAALFAEYAHVFRGRRQLFWSPGLQARLGVEDRADEEIAAEGDAAAVLVCRLGYEDWATVLAHEARADVLIAADQGGAPAVHRLLERLRAKPATHGAWFKYHERAVQLFGRMAA